MLNWIAAIYTVVVTVIMLSYMTAYGHLSDIERIESTARLAVLC